MQRMTLKKAFTNLLGKTVFGKTMESVRNRAKIKTVNGLEKKHWRNL